MLSFARSVDRRPQKPRFHRLPQELFIGDAVRLSSTSADVKKAGNSARSTLSLDPRPPVWCDAPNLSPRVNSTNRHPKP